MPTLYNPTDEPIRCQHGGMFATFLPGEEKEIFDPYAARHMLGRWGKFGLVDITFDEKIAKKYDGDADDYKHDQRVAGVTAQLETLGKKLQGYTIYDEACGEKQSPDRFYHKRNAKAVTKRIEEVTAILAKLEKGYGRLTPQQKAEALRKQARDLEMKAKEILKDGDNSSKSD